MCGSPSNESGTMPRGTAGARRLCLLDFVTPGGCPHPLPKDPQLAGGRGSLVRAQGWASPKRCMPKEGMPRAACPHRALPGLRCPGPLGHCPPQATTHPFSRTPGTERPPARLDPAQNQGRFSPSAALGTATRGLGEELGLPPGIRPTPPVAERAAGGQEVAGNFPPLVKRS